MFIVFEGMDGTGKTHHCSKLAHYLQEMGEEVVALRAPYGRGVRSRIAQGRFKVWTTKVRALMLDIKNLCIFRIKPALAEGKIVLCDRYIYSTWSYQVCAEANGPDRRNDFNQIYRSLPMDECLVEPDLIIWTDCEPELARERARKGSEGDDMDEKPVEFYQRVRQGYIEQFEPFLGSRSTPLLAVDTSKAQGRVAHQIATEVRHYLLQRGRKNGQH